MGEAKGGVREGQRADLGADPESGPRLLRRFPSCSSLAWSPVHQWRSVTGQAATDAPDIQWGAVQGHRPGRPADPGFCAQLLGGMEQMEQVLRSSGQYGARVEVPGGADTQTRLLGFIGRDPFWPER